MTEELMSPKEIADEAKRRALQQEAARHNLIDFTQYMFPRYVADPFHRLLASKLDDVLNGKIQRLMFFSPPQHGKELADSTPIFTPSGWRLHGDLQPDDLVYGRHGQAVKVLAVGEKTEEKVEI